MNQTDRMPPADKEGAKRKQYDRPVFVVYGDIRTITRNVGTTSQKNDPADGMLKTG